MKIGLFFLEITFITKFPCSNLLLPTFLTGGKFASCYLLILNPGVCDLLPSVRLCILSPIEKDVLNEKRDPAWTARLA